mgnify:FL=1
MNIAASDPSPRQDLAEQAPELLQTLFAPWVQDLNLEVLSASEGVARLRLPFNQRLCRQGGTVCGQALMAAADTAMVFAISSLFGEFRPMTTVSLNTSFMRAVAAGDVLLIAEVRKPGKSLMFGNIDMQGGDGKTVAQVTTTYMMM